MNGIAERIFIYEIDHACIADAGEILDLQKLAYQSEAIIYNDFFIPPLKEALDEIKREFSRCTFLKVCDNKRIIGSVRVTIRDECSEIGRLIVHPEFQGKGIGTRLMLAVEDEFPPAKRFELFTGSKSERNINLYEKLGYRIFARRPLSDLVELVFMEKYSRQ